MMLDQDNFSFFMPNWKRNKAPKGKKKALVQRTEDLKDKEKFVTQSRDDELSNACQRIRNGQRDTGKTY